MRNSFVFIKMQLRYFVSLDSEISYRSMWKDEPDYSVDVSQLFDGSNSLKKHVFCFECNMVQVLLLAQ